MRPALMWTIPLLPDEISVTPESELILPFSGILLSSLRSRISGCQLYLFKCTTVQSGSPLAYIGNDSRRTVSGGWFVVASRFRLGGKKEAAGAAVAVILAGIMDIE